MTTLTDNFNRTSADALGTASGGFSWTEVTGDHDIVSDTLAQGMTAGVNRAESDLASADHYSQIEVTSWSSFSNAEVHTRFSASAYTTYRAIARNDTSNTYRLFYVIAGSSTQIGSSVNTTAPTTTFTLRLETNGDQHTMKVNGSTVLGPSTDTNVTGNTRAGFGSSGTMNQQYDNFEAGDLATISYFAHRPMLLAGVGA